jgi:hypothetical protein
MVATELEQTLEAFLKSDDFEKGITASTKASWGGSGYSVELFEDGTWRVLWDNQIGNLYTSPGVILDIPTFDDNEYQECVNGENPISEEEFFSMCFANDEEEIAGRLRESLKETDY